MKIKFSKIMVMWLAVIMLVSLVPVMTYAEAPTYKDYGIITDDIDQVKAVFAGVADVTKDMGTGVVTIKLTSDVFGRIHFGTNSTSSSDEIGGIFVLDLGGKTIDGGISGENEAICFDHSFTGSVTITGEGKLKRGRNHIVYKSYHGNCISKFDLAEGMSYFTLKVDSQAEEIYYVADPISDHINGTELVLSQEVGQKYEVIFEACGGVVTPAKATTGPDGKLASLPTPAKRDSYTFDGWYSASSAGTPITLDTVYTRNTIIFAHWSYTGGGVAPSFYTVRFDENGGSEVIDQKLRRNSKAIVPVKPKKAGYTFDGWYVDEDLTEAYDFSDGVKKSITLYAKWQEGEIEEPEIVEDDNSSSRVFYDVDKNAWYAEDVKYVVENGIFNGVEKNSFAPNKKLTRAMLVTVLYRMAGEPATNRSIPFGDIDMGAYYASAVSWAKQNGIVTGITENEFSPNANITREQIASIIFRYAQYKGMDAMTLEENLHFNDNDEISEYAVSAMNWAVGRGLINGKTETTLNPKDNVTRAEIAAILHRFIESDK